MTKKYEPFNLERALAGEPVVLRDDSKAFVRHFEKDLCVESHQQLVGYLESGGRGRSLLTWDKEGFYFGSDSKVDQDIIGMYPQYKLIHGVKVPVFQDWEPQKGCFYLTPNPTSRDYYSRALWDGCNVDRTRKDRGLVYPHSDAGDQAAILHAKAMLGIAESDDD